MKLFKREKHPTNPNIEVSCEVVEHIKEWNPVRDNKEFINEHWELYPELVQEHIKNYDLIDVTESELHYLGRELEYSIEKIDDYSRVARNAASLDVDISGMLSLVSDYDKRVTVLNEKIKKLPSLGAMRLRNMEIEKQMEPLGWHCSYGTGGLHWNKSGVIQDGFGKYGCIDKNKSIGGCK